MKITCKKCKGIDFVEVCDGIVQKNFYSFKGRGYIKTHDKSDTYGEVVWECADCGQKLPTKQTDKLISLIQ